MSGCSEKLPAARGAGFEAEEDTSGYLKITTVYKGSSAELNGVLAGDIITAIDDTETKSLEELANALLNYKPGDTAEIHLFRPNESGVGGEEFTVTVTLLEDKGETQG